MKFRRILVLVCCSSLYMSAMAQLEWPAITKTTRPWTRWWWEGSAVNKKDLTYNLTEYSKAGLGGVEITPIYGVHGHEKEFISFLSPKWMEMFQHTLSEAKRLGIGVDLANATGWPFGGPWVKDEDASKTVYYKIYSVTGGSQLTQPVEYVQEGLVRTASNKQVSIDTLKQPVTANRNLQDLALDQVVYPGKLPLQALIAYGSKGTTIDLTSKVDRNSKLNWEAPGNDNWTLYALFVGLHGKMVERGAPGGEGYAIDHFSSRASTNYFKRFDEAFRGKDISYLRAFFNDSYEVDDARGQANWTPLFFEEFKKRRGYDLREHLPALFGKDNADVNARVIYDYRATIDELLLENFTEKWKQWGATKGAMVRNQSHGSPANTLDLYNAVDIPETEGTDILRFKFATSAANVGGKPLASSESATWLNEHFLSSLADVKKAIDLYFLGGVNHIFYHGTAYSPKDAPWPGWLFYAAVHFQETNPQWKAFSTLNNYIAHVQSFLQKSRPDNDILLYYPLVDRYSEPGRDLLQHFDGMERNFEGTAFQVSAKEMLDKGYGFDFFSDRQLQKFTTSAGKLITGGNNYKAILLPANKLIPGQSFHKLLDLAKNGATILVYKNLPADVPGFNNLEGRRNTFHEMVNQLSFTTTGNLKKAIIGKGAFILGDNLEELLKASTARKENIAEKQLSFIRKKDNEGNVYFITNRTTTPFDGWVPLNTKAVTVGLFDPMTGQKGLVKWRENNSAVEVHLILQPFQSMILQVYNKKKTGAVFPYIKRAQEKQEITGSWTIQFVDGGPVIPPTFTIKKLGSWTDLDNDAVKKFSGSAKYSTFFNKPVTKSAAYVIDLGIVHETAEVFLNGKKIQTLIGPSYQLAIPASQLQARNKLEVIVSNLMANRISYMDKNNIPWKIFYNTNMPARKRENVKNGLFDASNWKPLPSGLLGPVTLSAVTY
jgi:hypothetical protein